MPGDERRVSATAALVFCHGPIVIREIGGEFARAVAAGDEVEIRRRRRMQHGVERCLARQRDRRRRQAVARVGVEDAGRVRDRVALDCRRSARRCRRSPTGSVCSRMPCRSRLTKHRRDQRADRQRGRSPSRRSTRGSAPRTAKRTATPARALPTRRRAARASVRCARASSDGIGRPRREEISVGKKPALGFASRSRRSSSSARRREDRQPCFVMFSSVAQRFAQIAKRPALDDREARLRRVALRELGEQSRERRARRRSRSCRP